MGVNCPTANNVYFSNANKTDTYTVGYLRGAGLGSIFIEPNKINLKIAPFGQSLPTVQQIPQVKRIVYNNPATIVFWKDGTKTVVKCLDGQTFEKYAGFCAALAKKIFGGTSHAKRIAGAKERRGKSNEVVAEEPTIAEAIAE